MDTKLFLMNIKGHAFLVKLFKDCSFTDGVFINSHGATLYGESYIMCDRGSSNDELHVLMSWSEHNVSAIGTVEGHMAEETSELIVYNHNIIPFLSNVIII